MICGDVVDVRYGDIWYRVGLDEWIGMSMESTDAAGLGVMVIEAAAAERVQILGTVAMWPPADQAFTPAAAARKYRNPNRDKNLNGGTEPKVPEEKVKSAAAGVISRAMAWYRLTHRDAFPDMTADMWDEQRAIAGCPGDASGD